MTWKKAGFCHFQSCRCRCHQCASGQSSCFVCGFNLRFFPCGNTLAKHVPSISCGCTVSAMAGRPRTEWNHFLSFHCSKKKKPLSISYIHIYPATSATSHETRAPEPSPIMRACNQPTHVRHLIAFNELRRTVLYSTSTCIYLPIYPTQPSTPGRSHSAISREMPP